MSHDRITEEYRGYILVAANRDRKFQGQVWQGHVKVERCEGANLHDVTDKLRDIVDNIFVSKRQLEPIPNATEYAEAFRAIANKLSDGQIAMLRAHCRAKNQIMTATQLAEAAGYENFSAANLQYGRIGKWLYELTAIGLIMHEYTGEPIYTYALATGPIGKYEDTPEWEWQMRPEVATAIELLDL